MSTATIPAGVTAPTVQQDDPTVAAASGAQQQPAPDAQQPQNGGYAEYGQYAQQPTRDRGLAIASFVLGIASIVGGWTFIAPLTGLILGIVSLRRDTSERALALWGVWLNAAILALTVLALCLVLVLVSVGLFALPFAI